MRTDERKGGERKEEKERKTQVRRDEVGEGRAGRGVRKANILINNICIWSHWRCPCVKSKFTQHLRKCEQQSL